MKKNDLITVSSAAALLGISPDRVRQLERESRIRCVKTDRGLRLFDRQHIQEIAAERAKNESNAFAKKN